MTSQTPTFTTASLSGHTPTPSAPKIVAVYEKLWPEFKAAYSAATTAAHRLLAEETAALGIDIRATAFKWEPSGNYHHDYNAVYRKVIENIVLHAESTLAPTGTRIAIDMQAVREHCCEDVKLDPTDPYSRTEQQLRESFTPTALWAFLADKYNPVLARDVALKQTAVSVKRTLGLWPNQDLRRSSSTTTLSVDCTLEIDHPHGYALRYQSKERFAAIVTALRSAIALAPPDTDSATVATLQSALRDLDSLPGISPGASSVIRAGEVHGGKGIRFSFHKQSIKVRMANRFADYINELISEHTSNHA